MATPDSPDSLLEDAVACSLLRWTGDTRAARLYKVRREALPGGRPLVDALAGDLYPGPGGVEAVRAAVGQARRVLDRARDAGITPVVFGTAAYPPSLSTIIDPPIVLWAAGRLETLGGDAVAVVGSRRATGAGLLMARRLGRDLAAAGATIVSGLAAGIDAASHEGALEAGGVTVAVFGCGVDIVYPRQHADLARRIRDHGCLVSELPPGTPPLAHHFPLRNRVISGLVAAVVVVEAAERSGSLITARAALDQGRDVLAVPGPVVSGCHRGCHALIKDGAGLVETADDVVTALGWSRASVIRPNISAEGIAARMTVGEPLTVDVLAVRTRRSASSVLTELGRLEVAGVVARTSDGQFVRLD